MFKKTSVSASLTGLTAGLFIMLPASEADAATWTTHTKKYSQTKSFYSKPLKRCVRTTLSGKVTFKFTTGIPKDYTYKDIKIIEPKMTTKILTKCSGGKAATVTKMEMTRRWYESRKCEMDVEVSVGAPWSVSARRLSIRRAPNGKIDRRFCMSGRPTVQAYVKNNSDSWAQTMRFCFKP